MNYAASGTLAAISRSLIELKQIEGERLAFEKEKFEFEKERALKTEELNQTNVDKLSEYTQLITEFNERIKMLNNNDVYFKHEIDILKEKLNIGNDDGK